MRPSELMERLEEVMTDWSAQEGQRQVRRLRHQLLRAEDECSPARVDATEALAELLSLPPGERGEWLDVRSWAEDGVLLGCLLLDAADGARAVERLEFARLAARVSAHSRLTDPKNFAPLLDDNLGRAGLMEVRVLRQQGNLEGARCLFAELEAGFAEEESPLAFWLTLTADRHLTAGLLALDRYQTALAERHFAKTARYFRVAGTEYDDAELLFAQARLDLLRGDPGGAVDRLTRAAPFQAPELRLAAFELVCRAALRTRRPAIVRPALTVLTSERTQPPSGDGMDFLHTVEAGLRVLESRPAVALELLAGPLRHARQEGLLLGSLSAAVVAARAELARNRRSHASAALESGMLERFHDIPRTAAVSAAMADIAERVLTEAIDAAFLDRIDLWLILVEDSPGVSMEPQA